MDLSIIPSTKTLIQTYNLDANKKLGQNFLIDQSIPDKIIASIPPILDEVVIEVGPGPGALTRAILSACPLKLYAIEYDPRFIPLLETIASASNNKLQVLQADAMQFDENTIQGTPHVIANLPYNIGTALLIKWLHNITKFASITVMLQKEVVDRIVAPLGSSEYGRLTVLSNTLAFVERLLEVPPECFWPSPKVTSSVVRIVPKHLEEKIDLRILGQVTVAGFGMRRKKIRSSLSSVISETELLDIGIDPNKRAQELSHEDFCSITRYLSLKYKQHLKSK